MTSREILSHGVSLLSRPGMDTLQNIVNLRIAADLAWQREELGGEEHVQFAYRNNTPIVPPGHCCHPVELVKRGYIDGVGWPEVSKPNVRLFQWPDGNHWYVSVDGKDVVEGKIVKWNTAQEAEDAAHRYITNLDY